MNVNNLKNSLLICMSLCLLATTSISWGKKSETGYDVDKPPRTDYQLTDNLAFGARAEQESTVEQNFNQGDSDAEDEVKHESLMSLAFLYKPHEKFAAFMNIELLGQFYDDEDNKKKDTTKLEIKNAYIEFDEVYDAVNIRIGRMRFKDKREWLYDEELDGVRITYELTRGNVQFSVFDKKHKDILDDGTDEKVTN